MPNSAYKDIYRLSSDYIYREEDIGGILFNKYSADTLVINHSAARIFECLLQKDASLDILLQVLSSRFGEISETDSNLVKMFINTLLYYKIIMHVNNDPASINNISKYIYGDTRFITPVSESVKKPFSDVRTLRAPIFVWWDITLQCNLKCKQCYSSSGRKMIDELSTKEVYNIIDELARMKVFFIYFLGGEPFVRKDFFDILEYCASCGLRVMISTNGWLIDKYKAAQLARTGVQHVRVSLDGATAAIHDHIRGVSGSFSRAVRAIRNLKDAGIPIVGMGPTIMNENFHELERIIDFADELGVCEIQIGHICNIGRGRGIDPLSTERINILRCILKKKIREKGDRLLISGPEGTWEDKPFLNCVKERKITPHMMGCGGGRSAVAISPNGKVRCCLFYNLPVGDLRTNSFAEVWAGETSKTMQWLRSVKKGCAGCEHTEICAGPCPMERISTAAERSVFVERHGQREMTCKALCHHQ